MPSQFHEANADEKAFSVIIPLYNKAEHVENALRSITEQSRPAREVIVVDDGSTDGGGEICERLPGVRLVRQLNAGPGSARNRGVEEASGEWMAFLDADDFWAPSHLEELARIIRVVPAAKLVSCGHVEVHVGTVGDMPVAPVPQGKIRRVDYFRSAARDVGAVWSSAVAVHQDVFRSVGGFGPFPAGEDLEFWARAALNFDVAISDAPTAFYVRNVGGIMETAAQRRMGSVEWRVSSTVAQVSPSAATVVHALHQRSSERPKRSLVLYLNSRVRSSMRGAIWRGDQVGARRLSRLLLRPRGSADVTYVFIAHLPRQVPRAALQARECTRTLGRRVAAIRHASSLVRV